MTATIQNITLEQGTDFQQAFVVVDASGNPVNLTGAGAALQIRDYPGDPNALVSLNTNTGGLVITASTGTITAIIAEAVAATIVPGLYVYDLKLLNASGLTSRAFQGSVTVSPAVTTLTPLPYRAPGGQLIFSIAGNSGLAAGVF